VVPDNLTQSTTATPPAPNGGHVLHEISARLAVGF
jgi:hypothetical protein